MNINKTMREIEETIKDGRLQRSVDSMIELIWEIDEDLYEQLIGELNKDILNGYEIKDMIDCFKCPIDAEGDITDIKSISNDVYYRYYVSNDERKIFINNLDEETVSDAYGEVYGIIYEYLINNIKKFEKEIEADLKGDMKILNDLDENMKLLNDKESDLYEKYNEYNEKFEEKYGILYDEYASTM